MSIFWAGLKLDLKWMRGNYIKFVLFIMSAVILSLAIGLGGSQMLYDDVAVEPFELAIVDYEDSKWTHMIIDIVGQMETVTRLCNIQVMEEKQATAKLESGEVMAIISIPEHFVSDVMTGKNTPLTLEKKEGIILENVVVDKLITAAAKLLSSAQVGIYSTLDCYRGYGDEDIEAYNRLLQEVNIVFAKKMLARNQLFLEKEIVATGRLSVMAHYLLSGFVMMMLLGLMLTVQIIEPFNQQEMLMRYKVAKVKGRFILLEKWMMLTLYHTLLGSIILGIMALCSEQVGLEIDWTFNVNGYLGSLLTFSSLSAMGLLLGMLFKNSEAYGMFLFLMTIVQAFFSGGLLPSAFMPDMVNRLGYFTYTKYAIGLLGNLMGVVSEAKYYIGAGMILVGSLLGSCILMKKRGIDL